MSEEAGDKQNCPEWRVMLHGFLDDELDSVHAARFEGHLASCPHCTAELERLRTMRRRMRQDGVKWPMPEEVRSTILETLSSERQAIPERRVGHAPRMTWWQRALRLTKEWGFVPSLAALAASAFLFVSVPRQDLSIENEILASHVRSLLAEHLTDVQTSDQHTVKPWFNGKIDFSPPVVDLAAQGFPLVGGRVDYIGGRVVAALIYRRHGHVINLFVWPNTSATRSTAAHDGYNVTEWSGGGLVFWAVSDVSAPDLAAFRDNFVRAAGQ
jgi:anti-sigma factor RsiW